MMNPLMSIATMKLTNYGGRQYIGRYSYWHGEKHLFSAIILLKAFRIILPLIQEYVDSGAFTPKEKFKRSVKLNLIFYGVCGVLGIVFIIYLIITEQINRYLILSLNEL